MLCELRPINSRTRLKCTYVVPKQPNGYRRPSQFPRHLCTLAGPSVPPHFLRTLWINRLPPIIEAIIQHKRRTH